MSVWQMPQASSLTSASPAFGAPRSTSWTASGDPNSSSTAARIRICLLLSSGPDAGQSRRSRALIARRALLRVAAVGARKAGQKLGELLQLDLPVALLADRADRGGVAGRCLPQPLAAGVGDHRVAHARVARAHALADEAELLEPVEQPGDPGGRELEPLGQVGPAQLPVVGAGEEEQGLVVVHAEAVIALQLGAHDAPQRGVATQEPHPHLEGATLLISQ